MTLINVCFLVSINLFAIAINVTYLSKLRQQSWMESWMIKSGGIFVIVIEKCQNMLVFVKLFILKLESAYNLSCVKFFLAFKKLTF